MDVAEKNEEQPKTPHGARCHEQNHLHDNLGIDDKAFWLENDYIDVSLILFFCIPEE
jgi:hypothetical protein